MIFDVVDIRKLTVGLLMGTAFAIGIYGALLAHGYLKKILFYVSTLVVRITTLRDHLAPAEVECHNCGVRTHGNQRRVLNPDWTITDHGNGISTPAVPGHYRKDDGTCKCGWKPEAGNVSPTFQFAQHMTEVSAR